jgi:hypothetical protein
VGGTREKPVISEYMQVIVKEEGICKKEEVCEDDGER